ncbi:hypothetical protein PsYK624_078070 [Phanerochaete sordida]|uniref:Uncharacterized protein n=1 Tax=Phanerochaete sordida TaxID=48140 RepID=A0A9P3G9D1_9APHY|nr:hypothetical protein PsYK624_078070 [Phanerochaete sordida]
MLCSCKSYIRINVLRAPRGGTSSQSDTRLLTKPCAVGVEITSSMHAQADHLHTDATRKAVAVDQPACTIFIHVADSLWRRRSAVSCFEDFTCRCGARACLPCSVCALQCTLCVVIVAAIHVLISESNLHDIVHG